VRVVIADDSVLLREGAVRILQEAGIEVVGQAGDAEDLLRKVRAHLPDVAIVDIRMPPTNVDEGLQAAETLRAELPDVGVLVLSQYVEESYAQRLMSSGTEGVGYLLKDRVADGWEVADALRRVAAGGTVVDAEVVAQLFGRRRSRNPLAGLTEREHQVLALMAEGRTNSAISECLYLSPKTVEAHVRSIFARLGLTPSADHHRRVLAVLAFLRDSPGA
jgi:DNA-binding NarL/FixJ family response regulator